MKLTQRTTATGVTLNDTFIHVVNTGDTSQDPTGSSYKAPLSLLSPLFTGGTGGVAGSGTNNYVAKWTPDGTTLGNSLIQDDGFSIYNRGGGNINSNTAFGEDVLISNTTGQLNTGFGSNSLQDNTSGDGNTAVGSSSLLTNVGGNFNNAFGGTVLANNISGSFNNGVGYGALSSNTNGSYNNSFGYFALGSNTTGNHNIGIGHTSLSVLTTGNYNNTLGNSSFENLITGSNNIAIGYQAGRYTSGSDLTISNNSIFIGGGTRANIDGSSNEIVIGHGSIGLGQNTTVIGNTTTTLTRLEGQLQLDDVPTGTSINNLGIDVSGNVVVGSAGGSGGVTIDPYNDLGNVSTTQTWDVSGTSTNYELTLTGSITLNLNNVRNGDYGTLIVEQDGVGSHTLAFGTVNGGAVTHKVVNGGGGSPTLTSTPNAIDLLSFTYNGTTMYWTVGNDYT